MSRRYNHCARLSTPLLDKATVAERGHATDPRPPSGETQGRLAAEESSSFALLHADRVAGAGGVWIERTGKSPFFSPRARQCISFHAAAPENALCPGISWGALPHGPQTRLGQHCPAFLPPVPGAIAAGIPPHEAARSSSASSTWPGRRHLAHVAHALSPRPGAEPRTEQTLRERRRKERACVCQGGSGGPRSRRARVQTQLRLLNGRFLLCLRVDLNTYVMVAARPNAWNTKLSVWHIKK